MPQQLAYNQVLPCVFQPHSGDIFRSEHMETNKSHSLLLYIIGCIFRDWFEIDMGDRGAAQ